MDAFEYNGQKLTFRRIGSGERIYVWGHGWGHSSANLLPLAEQLSPLGTHYVLDFPGFGGSPLPATPWTLEDYAAITQAFITAQTDQKVHWVGHSFGCRVGLLLAAKHPDLIADMVLLAAPGLPLKKSLTRRLYVAAKIRLFKTLKLLARNEAQLNALRARFGSADYRNAGALRPTFINIVNRMLEGEAKAVTCKSRFIYGAQDSETPPVLGQRFIQLVPHADLHILDGLDHYTVLTSGKHQVLPLIKEFTTK